MAGDRLMRAIVVALTLSLFPQLAFAWGDDGHKVVALIAEHYLTPDVRNTKGRMSLYGGACTHARRIGIVRLALRASLGCP
jgi:hypothetical protein